MIAPGVDLLILSHSMVWSYHGQIQQVPASDMRLLPLIRLVPVPSIILILSINKSLLDWFEHQQISTCVETDLILPREGAVHTWGLSLLQ